MLTDIIIEYAEARKANDVKRINEIEKDMAKVGMDCYTLIALAEEVENGNIKKGE